MRTYRITGEKEHRLLIHRAIKFCQNLEDGKLTAMADIIPMSDEAFSELHDMEVRYVMPFAEKTYGTVNVKYFKMDENQYQMLCDERSLNLISGMCDLVSRVHMCQFYEVNEFVSCGDDPEFKKHHELRDRLDRFKRFWGLTTGYYGIYSDKISDEARSYWDMYQVMRKSTGI